MEERKDKIEIENKESESLSQEDFRKAALEYAKFLRDKGLKPEDVSREQLIELFTKDKNKKVEVKKDGAVKPVITESSKSKEVVKQEETSEVKKSDNKKAKVKKKEKKKKEKKEKQSRGITDLMASIVTAHDRLQDRICDAFVSQARAVESEYHKNAKLYKASRKQIGNSVITIALLSSALMLVFEHYTLYEYAYNGRVLGYVNNQTTVTDVLDVAGEHLSKNNNMEVKFQTKGEDDEEGNITFKKVSSEKKTPDDADQVVNKLAYMSDIETTAYGIYEDGKLLTILDSEYAAKSVLESVKAAQSVPDKGMELVSSKFKNNIEILPISVMLASIQEDSAARKLLIDGGDSKIYHIIDENETIETIEKNFSVTRDQIYDSTNKNVLRSYESGDKICIRKSTDPVEVEMVENGTMSEVVKYKTIKKKTDKMYKGDTVVKQEGINGKQRITGKITKVNGEVTNRDLTDIEILKKVQNKKILVGTAKRPKTEPTGIFGNPLDPKSGYVITSRVGPRWGSTHEGVDFGVAMNTPIHASDGGTIEISGVYGAYGYCVQIRHNDGYITRYGHCNVLKVKVGQKVYKGQVIALSGNTGRSTGPHLHFEIRKNGVVLDPGPIIGVYG